MTRSMAILSLLWLATGTAPAWADRPERDLSFLRPGVTLHTEVQDAFEKMGREADKVVDEWTYEMSLQKPHVRMSPYSIVPGQPPAGPLSSGTTLLVSPQEAAGWDLVPVRVRRYRRFLDEIADAEEAYVHLVYVARPKPQPDRLLYYVVELLDREIDVATVARRHGTAEEVEYLYEEEDNWTQRSRYLLQRWTDLGFGYVWYRGSGEYVARVHFSGPFGGPALAPGRRRERDIAFLRPGEKYTDILEAWRPLGEFWARPDDEWDMEMYLERPHIRILRELTLDPTDTPSEYFIVSPEDAARWTRVSVRMVTYDSTVAGITAEESDSISLVFSKDAAGAPDRLLCWKVSITPGELDWAAVVRRYGEPEDVEYLYGFRKDGRKEVARCLLRRFPAHGIGFVHDSDWAKREGVDPQQALLNSRYYTAQVFFPLEKR